MPNGLLEQERTAVLDRPRVAGDEPPPATGEPVLSVLDLQKTYRTGFWRRRTEAVRGISFAVAPGRVHALLGHNGAGKTTTMKAILGLVHPDAGRITLFGRDVRDRAARARVGYLPESPTFHDHLDPRELLDLHGRLCGLGARERRRRTDEVLALVGLSAAARLPLRKHSKGMLQRVGLAQALLHEPDLLILDEPMSGLDPAGRREVRELLRELAGRGRTILLSSHIVPDVEALADSVAILARGRLVAARDLDGADRRRVEVVLPALPSGPEAEGVLRACGGAAGGSPDAARPAAPLLVTAPDAVTLQRLLGACVGCGVTVLEVRTRRADLEEMFLGAVGAAGAEGAQGAEGATGAEAGRTSGAPAPAAPRDPARPRRHLPPHLPRGGRPW